MAKSNKATKKPKIDLMLEDLAKKRDKGLLDQVMDKYIKRLYKYRGKTYEQFHAMLIADNALDGINKYKMHIIVDAMAISSKDKGGKGKKGSGKRIRRSAEDIAKLQEKILDFVKSNPDCKAKAICAGVKAPKKDIAEPIRRLLKEKKLTKDGEKAGTTYRVK